MEEELDDRLGEMTASEESVMELSLLLTELFKLMVSTRPIESYLDNLKLLFPVDTCFNMAGTMESGHEIG